ncbi:MAG: WYL domain-containing protein [Lachnospiraceae bacterium]|jgi:predicted DNA-binding transcriptional regulator YafY|nr:WYL domain-containing protein [Lachnospiraceae bacterium]
MAKRENQKLKLYYLAKIMQEKTDEDHGLTMPQIIEQLASYDVSADRKSIYDDMEAMRTLGLDVNGEKEGKYFYYKLNTKKFELAELKLLVDSIQASKFITEKKSKELIEKLTSFASQYERTQLNRQLAVQGRIKTMNESIYYNVDEIHRAIAGNCQIRFDYMRWNLQKKLEKSKDKVYQVSPWALTFSDENYYLIAYDAEDDTIKHYRVDKMRHISHTEERRLGKEHFKAFDMAAYTKRNFGMYAGEETKVTIAFPNEKVGILLDRFGTDIPIRPAKKKGYSETMVDIAVSNQFFGWIFALGNEFSIVGPASVRKQFEEKLLGWNK